MSIMLDTKLSKAISTTKAHLVLLENMGLETVRDLLLYFPRTYEEHMPAASISDLRTDRINTIEAKIIDVSAHMSPKTRKWIYKALLEDSMGFEFEAVWFAKPYQLNANPEGKKKVFVGKAKFDYGKFTLQSPKIENQAFATGEKEIVPVYPATEKITSNYLLGKIKPLLKHVKEFEETLPKEVLEEEKLMSRVEAIKQIHFPMADNLLEKARERLAFEELFAVQMDALERKKEFQENAEKFDIAIPLDPNFIKSFFETLPFTPTNAQKISIFEILKDMEKEIPMSRLLEGDVGSGKTLVAATAALCAIKAGFQVAVMAPTEVLARQHYNGISALFQKFEENSPLIRGARGVSDPQKDNDKVSYIPYQKNLIEKARELRKNATIPEQKMWSEILQKRNFYGYKFHQQKPLDAFIVDFYCAELCLAIELDGDSHDEQRGYDEKRSEKLESLGVQVIRYANTEVLESIEGVYEDLLQRVREREKVIKNPPNPPYQGGSKEDALYQEGDLDDSSYQGEIKVGLLIGSQKKKEKQEALFGILNGETHLIIGTHALIQEHVAFNKLGLAIIDEQHRFGVEQRKKLASNGNPHTLNMTATPIPRTLALVAYGDQDLSVITEMPPGRQTIITKVVPAAGRLEISRFIDSEIEKGRQVYVVCPLIEGSKSETMTEVKSVTEEYDRLKELFPHREIGLMHGKLKSDEKDKVMQDFKERKTDMLVSTSVIEVGVDVPNATIMLIEGSERFGLSQLHQFRGRVGRGEHQSYCFLFTSKNNGKDNERLQAMEQFSDGFRLAEIDMRLRGPGEVYGVRQSGVPDLKMARLTDQKFVLRVRQAAEKVIESIKK